MKNSKKIACLSLLFLLASGCSLSEVGISSSSPSADAGSEHPSSDSSNQEEFSTSFEESNDSNDSGSSFSPSKPSGDFHFYCVNDFHGSILPNGQEAGLLSYFSFLAHQVDQDPEHTIILSAGDMFQGSLESNATKGEFVTEAMNAVPFDAMTLGNHEFDYGLESLYANMDRAAFPILGGNIVRYGTQNSWGKTKSTTILEKGGARIGIIGMIGEGQTTSITSRIVKDLDFASPKTYVSSQAKRLKTEEGCDLVVLVIHDDEKKVAAWGIDSVFSSWVDGIFCGHTHTSNTGSVGGVPCLQSYCNGKDYSYMNFTLEEGQVTNRTAQILPASKVSASPRIQTVYNQYLTPELTKKSNEHAGTVKGTLSKYGVARLGCKAIYETYKTDYPSLALTMENKQRSTLSGSITYGDIYKATPFTNNIVIADLRGDEIKNEARYNPTYTGDVDAYSSLEDQKYYTVGLIDYLYYHQNLQKRYDYFPSLNGLTDRYHGEHETYPMDLTFSYVQNTLGGVVNASDYSTSSPGFDLYGNPEN